MARKPAAKPPEPDDLSEFLPHGCTCGEGEASPACERCKAQRERIHRLYERKEATA